MWTRWAVCFLLLLCAVAEAQVQKNSVRVVFMEPDTSRRTESLPMYRQITDASRLKTYNAWLHNDAALWALNLYEVAWKISKKNTPPAGHPIYYVALVPGGNEGKVGFQLSTDSGKQILTDSTYIELEPDDSVFKATLFHETGHMILAMLNGGKEIPKKKIVSIPHTTAALTDRGTAFDEGFAIHLETLAAHFLKDPFIQQRYNHQRFLFGVPLMLGEYHRLAGDLLSFAQTNTRYIDVRENNFAFAPAFKGPDYFRVQLEKARDLAELRDANQLLQSEGFYATFFFSYLVRGDKPVQEKTLIQRQTKMIETLAMVLQGGKTDPDSPYLLNFVKEFIKKFPEEGREVLDVLLDLSHGVFVDQEASRLWHDHYLAALRVDLAEKDNKKIESARDRWRNQTWRNTELLYSFLGPQIRVEIPEQSILLLGFEEPEPLSFDVNTVEEGMIRMIPEIADKQVETWLTQRRIKAFQDVDDFRERSSLDDKVLRHLKFG